MGFLVGLVVVLGLVLVVERFVWDRFLWDRLVGVLGKGERETGGIERDERD